MDHILEPDPDITFMSPLFYELLHLIAEDFPPMITGYTTVEFPPALN
jgi:hypothetical protein